MRKPTYFDRTAHAKLALRMACDVRNDLNLEDDEPVSAFDACQHLGLNVRFTDINMEGMYKKGPPAKIFISALRPLPRRMFNCAHELGHHLFEHGSTIDELADRKTLKSWQDPIEFLADSFAGHFLMPAIGLKGAFNRRGWKPETATPAQLYAVACDFGVGYLTLVTHLHFCNGKISLNRFNILAKMSPKRIRHSLLDEMSDKPLIIAGTSSIAASVDIELNTQVLLPSDTVYDATHLRLIRPVRNALLLEPTKVGVTKVAAKGWSSKIRISREAYVGLSKFRYLEEL